MSTQINGIHYFPVDVRIFEDDKLAIVESEYGILATAVTIKLLCKIYSEGFYTHWDSRAVKLFRCKMGSNVSIEQINDVVNALIEEGFFDAEMYNNYQILTSKGIQTRFFEAISRRKKYKIEHEEYLLIEKSNEEDVCKKEAIADNSTEFVDNSNEFADNSKQRKEKENKSKKTTLNLKNNKEINNLNLTLPPACACARENFSFEAFHEMLEQDEDWQHSVVQASGKGVGILRLLPQIMPLFDAHIVSVGETGEIRHINDYKRRLICWWRCMKFNSAEEIIYQQNSGGRSNGHYPRQQPKANIDRAMEVAEKARVMAIEYLRQKRK